MQPGEGEQGAGRSGNLSGLHLNEFYLEGRPHIDTPCSQFLVPAVNHLESMFAVVAMAVSDEDHVIPSLLRIDARRPNASIGDQSCNHKTTDTPGVEFILQNGILKSADMALGNDTIHLQTMKSRMEAPVGRSFDQVFLV
jgi:hypothetical protein